MLSVGDKGTIKRGKAKGQGAEVVYHESQGQVAVKTAGGDLLVLDPSSFEKAPEPTIEIQTVRKAIERFQNEANNAQVLQALSSLAKDLELYEEYPDA